MRLISANALKIDIKELKIKCPHGVEENTQNMMVELFCEHIDNFPEVDIRYQIAGAYDEGYTCGRKEAEKEKPQVVYCKDCKHRDPEDKKCDCGGQERAGCIFRVRDDYFCAYGEKKGGADE